MAMILLAIWILNHQPISWQEEEKKKTSLNKVAEWITPCHFLTFMTQSSEYIKFFVTMCQILRLSLNLSVKYKLMNDE